MADKQTFIPDVGVPDTRPPIWRPAMIGVQQDIHNHPITAEGVMQARAHMNLVNRDLGITRRALPLDPPHGPPGPKARGLRDGPQYAALQQRRDNNPDRTQRPLLRADIRLPRLPPGEEKKLGTEARQTWGGPEAVGVGRDTEVPRDWPASVPVIDQHPEIPPEAMTAMLSARPAPVAGMVISRRVDPAAAMAYEQATGVSSPLFLPPPQVAGVPATTGQDVRRIGNSGAPGWGWPQDQTYYAISIRPTGDTFLR